MKKLKLMIRRGSAVLLLTVIAAGIRLGANEALPGNTAAAGDSQFVQCSTPRPEICYELYQPVCAVRDNGVRCVTAPCPSTEKATYSNDCKACADPAVYGFQRGGGCNTLNASGLDKWWRQWLSGSANP
ncbi:MAG: hypothetical protein CSA79_06185 [Thiothrix nivea]|nr:MAG: hypothetical protein CSA79_06185 [Thiothrix nivea]